jgi:hypothetical protein
MKENLQSIIKLITTNEANAARVLTINSELVLSNQYQLLTLCINVLNFNLFKIIYELPDTTIYDANDLFITMCNVKFKNIITVTDDTYVFFEYLYKKTTSTRNINQCIYNLLGDDNNLVLLEYLINKNKRLVLVLDPKVIIDIMATTGVYINVLFLISKVKFEFDISFFFGLIYNILNYKLDDNEQEDVILIIKKFTIDYKKVDVRYMNKLYLIISQYGNVKIYDYFNNNTIPNTENNKILSLEIAKMFNQHQFIETYWPADDDNKKYKEIEDNINILLSN